MSSSEKVYKVSLNFSKIIEIGKVTDIKKVLHDDEYRYFETLKYNERIKSFLLGRYSAKKAISKLTGEDNLSKILIKNGVFNQPVVVCESKSNINVSLTHCNDLAATVAFDDMLILGIDIEKINHRINKVIESELTQYEKELAYKFNYSYEWFLLTIWTIKESLSKVLKTGLTIPLSMLEVKNIEVDNGYTICTYTNFTQYCSLSFEIGDYICSITYPKNLKMNIDINSIKEGLYKMI